ncbi:MAG: 2-oxoacid:ferredoxin oxidoreductase subunit beta [Candidatus Dadabacteria bacterium]|nr:MAG: 2-oxoacid:ferredoxin oxidoreductase subunit beta [Candidatus Dadabacteria bacterium]
MSSTALTKKDFESGQEVRWCPGCGDYSILAAVQRLLPQLGLPREKHVFISGIGCSSRFPYYMNTYGFHTIHGRAPAVATGVKIANPELAVWVITGDGDALSIGGNHFLHLFRRNVDLTVLLFNNRIYGLTKGQYSPTSEKGKITKSTPFGSLDEPVNPLALALGAKATFVARALDVDAKGLSAVLKAAYEHKGASLVEIYQNCNVFNDGAHSYMSERAVRQERQILLRDGEKLVFGDNQDRGLVIDGTKVRVVSSSDSKEWDKVSVYDKSDLTQAWIMAHLNYPQYPVPMGVFYQEEREVYNQQVYDQIETARAGEQADLQQLLSSGETWEVTAGQL